MVYLCIHLHTTNCFEFLRNFSFTTNTFAYLFMYHHLLQFIYYYTSLINCKITYDVSLEDKTITLFLDCYKAHIYKDVRKSAEKQGIKLIFITPGCTDKCQPLDKAVFRALKHIASRIWWTIYATNKDIKNTRQLSIFVLIRAWDEINEETLEKAWKSHLEDLKEAELCDETDENELITSGEMTERINQISMSKVW